MESRKSTGIFDTRRKEPRAGKIGLHIIGAGAVLSLRDVDAMMEAGAIAVQMAAQAWLQK